MKIEILRGTLLGGRKVQPAGPKEKPVIVEASAGDARRLINTGHARLPLDEPLRTPEDGGPGLQFRGDVVRSGPLGPSQEQSARAKKRKAAAKKAARK